MPNPFYPAEPHHSDVIWKEADNRANIAISEVDFEDIKYGFFRIHARRATEEANVFEALVELDGLVFQVDFEFDLHLVIIAARIANSDEEAAYRKTLSQSD